MNKILEWLVESWAIILLMIVGFIVYALKAYDAEENQGKPRGYLIRKAILGGIGNALLIFAVINIGLEVTNLSLNSLIFVAGLTCFIGADSIFKMIEKALERYLLEKAEKKGRE